MQFLKFKNLCFFSPSRKTIANIQSILVNLAIPFSTFFIVFLICSEVLTFFLYKNTNYNQDFHVGSNFLKKLESFFRAKKDV